MVALPFIFLLGYFLLVLMLFRDIICHFHRNFPQSAEFSAILDCQDKAKLSTVVTGAWTELGKRTFHRACIQVSLPQKSTYSGPQRDSIWYLKKN